MFRFTIRDWLWLTALVAMAVCWRMDVRRRDAGITTAEERADVAELRAYAITSAAQQRKVDDDQRSQWLRELYTQEKARVANGSAPPDWTLPEQHN